MLYLKRNLLTNNAGWDSALSWWRTHEYLILINMEISKIMLVTNFTFRKPVKIIINTSNKLSVFSLYFYHISFEISQQSRCSILTLIISKKIALSKRRAWSHWFVYRHGTHRIRKGRFQTKPLRVAILWRRCTSYVTASVSLQNNHTSYVK